ncbi:MAG: DUF5678 domain-containing protein, partial [Candidatus Aenigmarchaeota archaeon]|nr:DUF5678 domain-containing protein [Candidatus Aenigmarchaeota archaeon]
YIQENRMRVDIEKLFSIQEEGRSYFDAHRSEFEQKFQGKFIAIKDKKILYADEDIDKVIAWLKKKKIDTNLVFIWSIPPKGIAAIL